MRQVLIIAIASLLLHFAFWANGQMQITDRYNFASEENAFYGCLDCHNRSTFRRIWSRLGSERLHEKHETMGTECSYCHHKPKEEVTVK